MSVRRSQSSGTSGVERFSPRPAGPRRRTRGEGRGPLGRPEKVVGGERDLSAPSCGGSPARRSLRSRARRAFVEARESREARERSRRRARRLEHARVRTKGSPLSGRSSRARAPPCRSARRAARRSCSRRSETDPLGRPETDPLGSLISTPCVRVWARVARVGLGVPTPISSPLSFACGSSVPWL